MNTHSHSDLHLAGASGWGMTRRDAIRAGIIGSAGLLVGDRLSLPAFATPMQAPASMGKAKAVIQIWLWGGPCHIDTFDPKPGAGNDITGPLTGVLNTNVGGIRIGEKMTLLAKQADKYSLIRSMTHGINAHETASYLVQTGRTPGERDVYPCTGAVVSLFKGYDAGYKGLIPPYIVLTDLQGRFSEAGFLGARYKPFATGGDPARTPFAVEGVVAQGISTQRQKDRRELLGHLNTLAKSMGGDAQVSATMQSELQAYDLILGDAGKVFDFNEEKPGLREAYGRTTFGQSCLMARRLVERGVPYVTINYKGWDTHRQHFQAMNRLLPELDRGLATLLQDLKDRGLLDSTIVWCCGEFSRTPRVQWDAPWNGGRNHFGRVFSALVAGGGFKGGQVVGATDTKGEDVADRPVTPQDLIGSMYELLGIDTNAKLPHPQGLDVRVIASDKTSGETKGRLREIMALA